MQRHGVSDDAFAERRSDAAMRALVHEQVAEARTLLMQGAPLAWRLHGRFGLEIRLIVAGGLRVCDRLARQDTNVFSRPRLDKWDKLNMIGTACRRHCPDDRR
jgi:phytoene/squalene synthetase